MTQMPYYFTENASDNLAIDEPREQDVLMGRGMKFQYHPGNILYNGTNIAHKSTALCPWYVLHVSSLAAQPLFYYSLADLVNNKRDRYFTTKMPMEKKSIIEEIVDRILQQGRFLQRDAARSCWVPISKERALTKVAHAIQYQQRKTMRDVTRGFSSVSPCSGSSNNPSFLCKAASTEDEQLFQSLEFVVEQGAFTNSTQTSDRHNDDLCADNDSEMQMLQNIQQWQQSLKSQEEHVGIAAIERAYISNVNSETVSLETPRHIERRAECHVVCEETSELSELHVDCRFELVTAESQSLRPHPVVTSIVDDAWINGCGWDDSDGYVRLDLNRSSSTLSLVSLDDDLDTFMANLDW
jgi:hypothetical protein